MRRCTCAPPRLPQSNLPLGRQWYVDRPENLWVENGQLMIRALYEAVPTLPGGQVGGSREAPGGARRAGGCLCRAVHGGRRSTCPPPPSSQTAGRRVHSCPVANLPPLPSPPRSPQPQKYTSARIRTARLKSFVPDAANKRLRIEARVKADAGAGLWPAFWALPEDFSNSFAYCSGCGTYGGRAGAWRGGARGRAGAGHGAGQGLGCAPGRARQAAWAQTRARPPSAHPPACS